MAFRLISLLYLNYWTRLEISFIFPIDFQVKEIKITNIDQGSANCSPWAQSSPIPCVINKVLLEIHFI
jgi:hypothetical protein